ncbi:MAG: hypothetical protein LBV60_19210, partial [Streptomyces sp.]|nr:hypothetical protein [Streptomyces sp.]
MTTDGFSFLDGSYDVANRWRKDFLEGPDEWEEFPGRSRATVHFRGNASHDEIDFPTKGFTGMTLRLYEPDTGQWSLYWANSTTGRLFPPVRGGFRADGTGLFEGDDTHHGKPVRVRYLWSGITDTEAHWEQSFSGDGGATWVVNWHM